MATGSNWFAATLPLRYSVHVIHTLAWEASWRRKGLSSQPLGSLSNSMWVRQVMISGTIIFVNKEGELSRSTPAFKFHKVGAELRLRVTVGSWWWEMNLDTKVRIYTFTLVTVSLLGSWVSDIYATNCICKLRPESLPSVCKKNMTEPISILRGDRGQRQERYQHDGNQYKTCVCVTQPMAVGHLKEMRAL